MFKKYSYCVPNVSINQNHHKVSLLNFALVLFCVVCVIVPFVGRNVNKIGWMGLMLLWYVDILFHSRRFLLNRIVILSFLWIIYLSVLGAIGFSSVTIGNYYFLIVTLDLVCKSIYVGQFYNNSKKLLLMRIIQIVFLCSILDNIFTGIYNPVIFQEMAIKLEVFNNSNAFSTGHYEALAFYVIGNLYLLKKEKSKYYKCIEILSIVACLIFMFSFSPRMNAIIIMIMFSFILYSLSHRVNMSRIILNIVILFLLVICLFTFADVISSVLPERVAVRFDAMMNVFAGRSVQDSEYTSRFVLQMNSLETFLGSPLNFLYGVGWHLGPEYYYLIGQHALITNYAAFFGCIGIAFLTMYYMTVRKNMLFHCGFDHMYCKASLAMLLFCSVISLPLMPENLSMSVFFASLVGYDSCVDKEVYR